MSIYVLQVRSGKEETVCKQLNLFGLNAFVPMKKMLLRRGGIWQEKNQLIFTQYVFLDFKPGSENYALIRQTNGFVRFLGAGLPEPLSRQEEAYIQFLRNGGKPIEISRIRILPDGTKEILSGALQRFQDSEIKYHLRQHRAVVSTEIMGRKRNITLPVMTV